MNHISDLTEELVLKYGPRPQRQSGALLTAREQDPQEAAECKEPDLITKRMLKDWRKGERLPLIP